MTDLKSTIINAGWLLSDRIVRLSLNLVAGILIARALGPESFGLLSYGQALIFLVTPLATLGLPEIIVRELSRRTAVEQESERQEIIASALAIRASAAVASAGIMTMLAFVAEPDDIIAKTVIILYGLSIAPQSLDVFESALQSKGLFKIVSLARSMNSITFAVVRIASAYMGFDVIWFAALNVLEVLVFGAVYLFIARQQHLLPSLSSVRLARMRLLVKSSAPLMLRLLAIAIYMRIDQVMIRELLGEESLGAYSVAVRISELWYFIPGAIMTAALPRLTRSYEQGMAAYEAELRYWMRMMMMIALPAALGLSLLAGPVIQILFGPAYADAAHVLSVQAWAGVFVAIGVATGPWFINTGLLRFGLYQACIGAAVSVALNFLLIPRFGLMGASFAMVASQAISAVLCNGLFRETRPLFRLQLRAMMFR